jgi:hypothetical protein
LQLCGTGIVDFPTATMRTAVLLAIWESYKARLATAPGLTTGYRKDVVDNMPYLVDNLFREEISTVFVLQNGKTHRRISRPRRFITVCLRHCGSCKALRWCAAISHLPQTNDVVPLTGPSLDPCAYMSTQISSICGKQNLGIAPHTDNSLTSLSIRKIDAFRGCVTC